MIKIKVPATTANVGPGFDTFGLALSYYNTVTVIPRNNGGQITVENLGETTTALDDPKHNLVVLCVKKVFAELNYQPTGLHLLLENKIPVSRGLGSSAAAIVGGLFAGNAICGNPLSKQQLLQMAVEVEGHPDNVAPAIFGGFVASCQKSTEKTLMLKAAAPDRLKYVVAIPDFYLSTRLVREAIPKQIPIADAVFNLQRASLLVGALLNDDLQLFREVVEDRLHQPYRMPHIKGSEAVLAAATEAGALASAVSGSGPTLIAFCQHHCERVAKAMEQSWAQQGVNCRTLILQQDHRGAYQFS